LQADQTLEKMVEVLTPEEFYARILCTTYSSHHRKTKKTQTTQATPKTPKNAITQKTAKLPKRKHSNQRNHLPKHRTKTPKRKGQ